MHSTSMREAVLVIAISIFCQQALADERTAGLAIDPFQQATHGRLPCATPTRPVLSEKEIQEQEHIRTQHGYTCHTSGRCRLPNSHLYDAELLPRLVKYLGQDERFSDSAVWVGVQRRLVTLAGCVKSQEQAFQMEQAALLVDDVMGVINELRVVK